MASNLKTRACEEFDKVKPLLMLIGATKKDGQKIMCQVSTLKSLTLAEKLCIMMKLIEGQSQCYAES